MKGAYYYFISGLPELELDGSGDLPSFASFVCEAVEHLTSSDAALLRILRLPIDNGNLINILEKREALFNEGGNYGQAELVQEIAGPESMPEYMRIIIEAHKSDVPIYNNITWEDQLNWLFYDYAEVAKNRFLRDWFSFDLNVGNLLSALKCREFNISFERRLDQRLENLCSQAIIGHNEVSETILESNAPDLSLASLLPWVEDVLDLDRTDLVGFEKGIDLIKWKWLDDMTSFNHFDIEVLLSYGIKLQMAQRWLSLDGAKGARRFNELLAGMEGGYQGCNDNMPRAVRGAMR